MPESSGTISNEHSHAGLCGACEYMRIIRSSHGSEFYRCGYSDIDDRYLTYPPLPVAVCEAFQPQTKEPIEKH